MKASNTVRGKAGQKRLTPKVVIATLHSTSDALKEFSVRKIGLFGSYAAGRQTQKSDLDFVVEFNASG